MTSDVKLLPCPFCGNEVQDDEGCFQSGGFRVAATSVWSVRCGNPSCNADVSAPSADAAIAAWNRRACVEANTEALRAELDEQCRLHAIGMERELALTTERDALRRDRDDCLAAREHYAGLYGEQHGRAERLAEALRVAEAALADIGDADREPGDDVAWCERRAAQALPTVRATLADQQGEA